MLHAYAACYMCMRMLMFMFIRMRMRTRMRMRMRMRVQYAYVHVRILAHLLACSLVRACVCLCSYMFACLCVCVLRLLVCLSFGLLVLSRLCMFVRIRGRVLYITSRMSRMSCILNHIVVHDSIWCLLCYTIL